MPCPSSYSTTRSPPGSWSPSLLTGPPHRQGEVAEYCARLPTEDGIPSERCQMFAGKQDSPRRIHCEPPHRRGHTAGQPQLARRIKKQQHPLADAVPLPARPQPNPLRDGQLLAGRRAANRLLDMKRDRDRLDCLPARRRTPRHARDRPGKNDPRRLHHLRKASRPPNRTCWPHWPRQSLTFDRQCLSPARQRPHEVLRALLSLSAHQRGHHHHNRQSEQPTPSPTHRETSQQSCLLGGETGKRRTENAYENRDRESFPGKPDPGKHVSLLPSCRRRL